jgi:hypothetical protein
MDANREDYEAQDDRITLIEKNYMLQGYDGATLTSMLLDIGFMSNQVTKRVQMEFGEMLTRAGWQRSREMVDGRRQYVWRPSK